MLIPTWNAISDQILLSPHLSWSTESGEHDSVGNGDTRWSPRLDQSTYSPPIQNGYLVNTNNEILSQQSSIGRRVQVFSRGLKQSSAAILSYNNKVPVILDVFWVDSGPLFETPTIEEIQYSIKSLVDPITVPSTTLPALGDKLRYSWAYNQATFDMVTAPGFDLTWNFSGLTADENPTEEYLSPGQDRGGRNDSSLTGDFVSPQMYDGVSHLRDAIVRLWTESTTRCPRCLAKRDILDIGLCSRSAEVITRLACCMMLWGVLLIS